MVPSQNPPRWRRGSVLVESSFALLPLMALLFGVIDIAFAVFVRNTMQFAVRQGVRYAVTSQTMPGLGQDQSIQNTVNTYAMGLLDGLSPTHDGMSQISITYYDPVSLALVTGPGSNVGGNIVCGVMYRLVVGMDGAADAGGGADAVYGFLGGHHGGHSPCRTPTTLGL
jgi:hypothetical protein